MRMASMGHGVPATIGIATNQSGGAVSDAFIKFNQLDTQGQLVGNTIAQANNLAAGQAWHFSAPIATPGAINFKVGEIKVDRK